MIIIIFLVILFYNSLFIAWNRKITRRKFLHTLRQFPDNTLVTMEACGSAHHWARQFRTLGHHPTQHVKQLSDLAYILYQLRVSIQIGILSAEYRVMFPVGIRNLKQQLLACLEDADNGVSFVLRRR